MYDRYRLLDRTCFASRLLITSGEAIGRAIRTVKLSYIKRQACFRVRLCLGYVTCRKMAKHNFLRLFIGLAVSNTAASALFQFFTSYHDWPNKFLGLRDRREVVGDRHSTVVKVLPILARCGRHVCFSRPLEALPNLVGGEGSLIEARHERCRRHFLQIGNFEK